MQTKFYKKLFLNGILSLIGLSFFSNTSQAQVGAQGLKISSVDYTATTATVYVKAVSLTNVIGLNGTITWDKNSLQHVSTTMGSNVATLSGQFNAVQANGTLTYIVSEPNVNAVNLATDTILFAIKFNVINNPLNTYNNNTVGFSNAPLPLEVDTSEVGTGLPVQVLYPALENHTAGSVAFARPPVLSYAAGDITDSVTNRPSGCTYQWLESSSPVAGPNASTYPSSPSGTYGLQVTYPNGVIVTSLNTVLGVKLVSFNGKFVDNTNQLNWATAKEMNTKNFEIQKSDNGKDFAVVGVVAAATNSSTQQNYTFTDANLNNKIISYYRLKMNDNNGVYTFSNIIRISKNVASNITIYPNPAKNIVNIAGDKIELVTVTDLTGKVVLQKRVDFVNNTTLNLSNLTKGIYSINVLNASGVQISKLIVE